MSGQNRHDLLTLNRRDRRQFIRLLGLLQTHLESAIESSLIPGTSEPMDADKGNVEADRKDWALAEYWVQRLTRQGGHRRKRAVA